MPTPGELALVAQQKRKHFPIAGDVGIREGSVVGAATVTTTPVITRVATSTASATLVSANADRKGAIIHNESAVVLYIKFGTTASATDYTVALAANTSYQLPSNVPSTRIDGILAAGVGNAQCTEW